MSVISKLIVAVEARTASFHAKMTKLEKRLGGMGRSVKSLAGAFGGLGGMLTAGAVVGGLAKATALAAEQQDAETKLGAVLNATGGAAGRSAEQLKGLASELQKTTRFGDEATIAAMSVMATFKQIKGDTFDRATRAAQDMATVMGTDLRSSTLQLGKALNDPARGLTQLQRVGVTFTESQRAQVQAMTEAGDVAGAQALMLAELESQFGGAAAASAGTFAGQMEQLKNNLGDVAEGIGKELMPYLKMAADWLSHLFLDSTAGASGAIKTTAALGQAFGWVADAIDTVVDMFKFAQWWAIQWYTWMAKGIATVIELAAKLPWVGDKLKGVAEAARAVADSMQGSADAQWDKAKAAWDAEKPSQQAAELSREMDRAAEAAGRTGRAMETIVEPISEATKAAGDLVKSLQRDLATFGMDSTSAKIWDLDQQGADSASLNRARALAAQLEQMKKHQADLDMGKSLFEDTRTPMEQYQKRLEDLDRLLGVGAIDADTAARAALKAEADLMSTAGQSKTNAPTFAGAMQQGSREAYSAILRHQGSAGKKDPNEEIRAEAVKQTAHLIRIARILEETRDVAETEQVAAPPV